MCMFCLSDVCIVLLLPDETLEQGGKCRHSSGHFGLNCVQCIAYVFECSAMKMT